MKTILVCFNWLGLARAYSGLQFSIWGQAWTSPRPWPWAAVEVGWGLACYCPYQACSLPFGGMEIDCPLFVAFLQKLLVQSQKPETEAWSLGEDWAAVVASAQFICYFCFVCFIWFWGFLLNFVLSRRLQGQRSDGDWAGWGCMLKYSKRINKS